MRYEILSDDGTTVENVIVATRDFVEEHFSGRWRELPEAPALPIAPASVTMRQARLALLNAGKLAGVDAAINSLPSPDRERARIEWDYARDVMRDSPLTKLLGPALGLDDADLDALFMEAATL